MAEELSYGDLPQTIVKSELDLRLEELKVLGFTIIENLLPEKDVQALADKVMKLYQESEAEYGKEYLASINELNLLRCLIVHDEMFLRLAIQDRTIEVVEAALGNNFVLNQQNAIINIPDKAHHQRSWHRDLPYQNYVVSKAISISALFCVNDFNEETGGTELIPYSHNLEVMPSQEYCDKHKVTVNAKAGGIIVFNSMLIHRAGFNHSGKARIGINHMYTIPLLKQQIDLPKALNGKYSDNPLLAKILGYQFQVPESDQAWKEKQKRKLNQNAKI